MLDKSGSFELSAPVKTVLCFGDTAHLSVPEHAYLAVTPSSGITFNSDSTELVFSPGATTSYTITGFSEGACAAYDTVSFTMSVGLESFSLSANLDTQYCKGGGPVDVAILPHDHFEVSPTTDVVVNADESLVTFSPATTTTYTLTGYIGGPCPTYDTQIVTIVVNEIPVASFNVTPGTIFLDDPIFTLSNNSTGADLYKWFDATGNMFSTDHSPSVTEAATGQYCYQLVAESFAGCADTATDCGEIINNEKVFFPSAFTPNNDGRNDLFKPVLLNIDLNMVQGYSMVIVNRFGQVVYKSVNATDPGWDGRFQAGKCDVGTYFYTCKFVTPQGKAHEVKGDLTLVQ
jgi:gliding motility-associated-like protein